MSVVSVCVCVCGVCVCVCVSGCLCGLCLCVCVCVCVSAPVDLNARPYAYLNAQTDPEGSRKPTHLRAALSPILKSLLDDPCPAEIK